MSAIGEIEPSEHTNWDIKRDAFAPPDTRRIMRAWDRAPIPAHAPRLQGQKVWKKVAAPLGKMEHDGKEAQDELEKEGAGQRKKARSFASKQNIMNATWLAVQPNGEDLHIVGSSTDNPPLLSVLADVTNIKDTPRTSPMPTKMKDQMTMPDLHFIPRKRTNTNHVISPKKAMRQTTLDIQAQRQSITAPAKIGNEKRPRKSLRTSIATGMDKFVAKEAIILPVPQKVSNMNASTRKDVVIMTEDQANLTGADVLNQGQLLPATENIQSVEEGESHDPEGKALVRRITKATRSSIAYVEKLGGPHASVLQNTGLPKGSETRALGSQSHNQAGEGRGETVTEALLVGSELQTTTADLENVPMSADVQNVEEESADSSLSSLDSTFDEAALCSLKSVAEFDNNDQKDHNDSEADAVPFAIPGSSEAEMVGLLSVAQDSEQCGENEQCHATSRDMVNKNAEVLSEIDFSEDATNRCEVLEQPIETTEVDAPDAVDLPAEFGGGLTHKSGSLDDIQSPLEDTNIEDLPTNFACEVSSSAGVTSTYDHDDTDMLRNFLTRAKANKAAKKASPKRKRSLPHSPLRIPLGDMGNNLSPLSLQQEVDFSLAAPSPSKRNKKGSPSTMELDDEAEEPKSCRRSTRTRLPVKSGAPPIAPSLIPMRRLLQEDTTVILKRNEEKELAALTRVNTRKNKGTATPALEVLAKKMEEKDDPAMRQRLLKEVFEMKIEQGKGKGKKARRKTVTWAEELAQFQTLSKTQQEPPKEDKAKEKDKKREKEKEKEKEEEKTNQGGEERKQGTVRVGVRSKIALGMATNGTPAPKRKGRGKS